MGSGDPGDLIYEPDHEGVALRQTLSQFRRMPVARALTVAFARAVQRAEDELFGLYADLPLENATGRTLDMWGRLVGADRMGLDDAGYRDLIRAMVVANHSQGDVDALLRVWAAVTAPSTVAYTPLFPACFRLTAWRDEPLDGPRARYAGRLMRRIQPGGRAMVLLEVTPGHLGLDDDGEPLDEGALVRTL